MTERNILEEAEHVINGPRAETYGSPFVMCCKIANMWTSILDVEVTPEQVNLCMIALKICRETNKHSRDNLVDIAGYAAVMEKMLNEIKKQRNVDGSNKNKMS